MPTRRTFITSAFALVLLITLWAGIKPKGYRFHNDVIWIQPHGGIAFGHFGIAYTNDSLKWVQPNLLDNGFTIEISVKANKCQTDRTAEIMGFCDGTSPEPLMVGQWLNHLIVRVRDENGKLKYQEFGSFNALELKKMEIVQIVFDQSKLLIYNKGKLSREFKYSTAFSTTGLYGKFFLGNSSNASNPWQGEFHGIVLYQRKLSSQEINFRFKQWNSSGCDFLPSPVQASHIFQFNEGRGNIVHDYAGNGFDIIVPPLFHIIKKRILTAPWDDFQWDFSYFSDVVINLFGFIPLGFFLSLFLFEIPVLRNWKKNLFLTISICFFISLFIELVQVYIPTRASQLSDIILNTIGGMLGGIFAKMMHKSVRCPLGDLFKK
jgi:hypothetical protein